MELKKKQASVATGHPVVTQAAIDILNLGGNAYDAVIAAGFTSAVAEPALTSLGGGGFLLARTVHQEQILFDFFTNTPGIGLTESDLEPHFFPITVEFPSCNQDFNIGLGSVAVPGNLKGYIHVHNKLGKLPLKTILKPAIHYAQKGIRLNSHQAYFLKLLEPIMLHSPIGQTQFSKNGNILQKGDKIFNLPLAEYLKILPKSQGDDFYSGSIAKQISHEMEKGQGLLTYQDLSEYKVLERPPLSTSFQGRTLLTNPFPSMGGSMIAATLQLIDRVYSETIKWGSKEHLCSLANILQQIENHRDQLNINSEFTQCDWFQNSSNAVRSFCRGTTHISIIDLEGNAASMTTSNGEGSGYYAPGTGILLNNMMGEDDLHPNGFHSSPPGEKISSMMSPSIITKDNLVEMVIGSGGSKRIRSAIPQVISNVINFRMPMNKAVNSPRIHWDGDILQIEPGYPESTLTEVNKRISHNLWNENNIYFGGVHAVSCNEGGAGDLRRGGNSKSINI